MMSPIMVKKIIGTIAIIIGGFWIFDFISTNASFTLTGAPQLIFGIIAVAIGVIFHAT